MIKSLSLSNFQSHKKSFLEFDPGLNVIIGGSDSGKTAIIRALRWLVWNRPLGDAMRSTWGGKTIVDLKTDYQRVIRFRDKLDEYQLDDTFFKAFGTTVPEEITQALNLNEINLQQQLDSPFLLDDSPGDVAKHFNKVAHLDQIDSGLKNIQSWLNEIARAITSDEQREQQLTEDLTAFANLDKYEIGVEILERQHVDMISQINQVRKLEKLILDSVTVSALIEDQNKITKAGPLVDKILDWYIEINQINQEKEELEGLIQEIEEAEITLEKESRILPAEKSVMHLLSLFQDQVDIADNYAVLNKLIKTILHTTEEQKAAETRSKRLQTEFNAVFPDVCPLCGKPK